jgi:dihydropteroate synthase
MILRCGSRTLDLSTPIVMGVLNVTPDSFSDGGRWANTDTAIARGLEMVQDGAGIVDIGGESTRPGAATVSESEELRRVLPVVKELAKRVDVPISVDTSRARVIEAVCAEGASFINDVRALSEPGALEATAKSGAAVCVMHMQGQPQTMQKTPEYANAVREVTEYLQTRVIACRNAGIALDRIVVDPGVGFGKRLEHNLELLAHLDRFRQLDRPILIGVSRKSLIGTLTGREVQDRLAGSLAFATAAILSGASIIRAHDVAETCDAVRIAVALKQYGMRNSGENMA